MWALHLVQHPTRQDPSRGRHLFLPLKSFLLQSFREFHALKTHGSSKEYICKTSKDGWKIQWKWEKASSNKFVNENSWELHGEKGLNYSISEQDEMSQGSSVELEALETDDEENDEEDEELGGGGNNEWNGDEDEDDKDEV